jgi:adenylate cyclase
MPCVRLSSWHRCTSAFFSVPQRYAQNFDAQALERISSIINAGTGITVGTVVMGDLGPKRGVRKFGILGNPINLAALIESLTRLFSTDIIFTGDIVGIASALGFPTRRLGRISVKGRKDPEILYAVGNPGDRRFTSENISAWERWLAEVEQHTKVTASCLETYRQDRLTVEKWLGRNALGEDGIWHLEEK